MPWTISLWGRLEWIAWRQRDVTRSLPPANYWTTFIPSNKLNIHTKQQTQHSYQATNSTFIWSNKLNIRTNQQTQHSYKATISNIIPSNKLNIHTKQQTQHSYRNTQKLDRFSFYEYMFLESRIRIHRIILERYFKMRYEYRCMRMRHRTLQGGKGSIVHCTTDFVPKFSSKLARLSN